jgi:hypothetical protein
VSVALGLDGLEILSRTFLVVAALVWAVLGLVLARRVVRGRARVHREARTPAALTGVAATAVLGARVTTLGWTAVGVALLVVALMLWCALLVPVLARWTTPTVGSSLLLVVSTESLAVLSATIADRGHHAWLADASRGPFLLGLALYAFVMARFDWRELTRGVGDHWITGGALAISTLAAAQLTLPVASVVLWAASVAWLPVLVATELLRPRLAYDLRRWSTVFPIGMYAACSTSLEASPRRRRSRTWDAS